MAQPGRELLLRRPAAARPRADHHERRVSRVARPHDGAGGGVMGLLERDRTAVVVIDVQEGFRPYASFAPVAAACAKLLAAARILDLPALVSEQYPKGL